MAAALSTANAGGRGGVRAGGATETGAHAAARPSFFLDDNVRAFWERAAFLDPDATAAAGRLFVLRLRDVARAAADRRAAAVLARFNGGPAVSGHGVVVAPAAAPRTPNGASLGVVSAGRKRKPPPAAVRRMRQCSVGDETFATVAKAYCDRTVAALLGLHPRPGQPAAVGGGTGRLHKVYSALKLTAGGVIARCVAPSCPGHALTRGMRVGDAAVCAPAAPARHRAASRAPPTSRGASSCVSRGLPARLRSSAPAAPARGRPPGPARRCVAAAAAAAAAAAQAGASITGPASNRASSRFRGVCLCKESDKWRASVWAHGKHHSQGLHRCKMEAARQV